MRDRRPGVLVAGEALLDFVPRHIEGQLGFIPVPGGSPLNVAVGLARLGIPASFLGRLSTDLFGRILREHLEQNEVDMQYVLDGEGPSTLAFVSQREDEEPIYAFYAHGAVDRQIGVCDLPETLPDRLRAIHVGSYSLAVDPIAGTLESLIEKARGERVVSLDPNVRPSLVGHRETYLQRLERFIERADIVKLSRADATWAWPDADATELARQWLRRGPSLIVLTDGAAPVLALMDDAAISAIPPSVDVVDSIGAGDAFTAALLCWLQENGRLTPEELRSLSPADLTACIDFASHAAAFTCTRRGANPPTRSEVESFKSHPPHADSSGKDPQLRNRAFNEGDGLS